MQQGNIVGKQNIDNDKYIFGILIYVFLEFPNNFFPLYIYKLQLIIAM